VSTTLPEDPRTDVHSVFGGEEQFEFRRDHLLRLRGAHQALPVVLEAVHLLRCTMSVVLRGSHLVWEDASGANARTLSGQYGTAESV
jgi:hypothetical protein